MTSPNFGIFDAVFFALGAVTFVLGILAAILAVLGLGHEAGESLREWMKRIFQSGGPTLRN